MLAFLAANIGTILVGAALLAIVLLIIAKLIRDKRQGKHACSGSCGGCSGCGGGCHSPKRE